MTSVRNYPDLRLIFYSSFFLLVVSFSFNCLALDSFKISAIRYSKAFACHSVIGDARRKAISLCKKQGDKKLNYDTYDVPIVCDWEDVSGGDRKNPKFKATIEVKYECRGEDD